MFGATPQERAYFAPFLVFMALLGLGEVVAKLAEGNAWWVVAEPRYWVFPLQTVICGATLAVYWRHYRLQWPKKVSFTLAVALLVFAIWVAPQEMLGQERRWEGFDPYFFADETVQRPQLALRFIRLVIVVPLLEEIFWRGFLLRYLIRERFLEVPFGTFSWQSFGFVAALFALAHFGPDLWPALITGVLYNAVAYRTRSLSSCILAHAVTNLLLGIYIMRTGQWGFW